MLTAYIQTIKSVHVYANERICFDSNVLWPALVLFSNDQWSLEGLEQSPTKPKLLWSGLYEVWWIMISSSRWPALMYYPTDLTSSHQSWSGSRTETAKGVACSSPLPHSDFNSDVFRPIHRTHTMHAVARRPCFLLARLYTHSHATHKQQRKHSLNFLVIVARCAYANMYGRDKNC